MTDNNDLTVKLVYKDGCPVFQNAGKEGDELLVHFGANRRDFDYIPLVLFDICIFGTQSKDEWIANYNGQATGRIHDEQKNWILDEESQPFVKQSPKVKEMVDKINVAIAKRQELDLTEYIYSWQQLDVDYFRIIVNTLGDFDKDFLNNDYLRKMGGTFKYWENQPLP